MMDVLTSLVLSHFHIVSMLLSLKSILAPFARRGFIRQCYEKLHIDQFWVLKGLNQSNKIGMLHKIRQNKTKMSNIPDESQSLLYSPSLLFSESCLTSIFK